MTYRTQGTEYLEADEQKIYEAVVDLTARGRTVNNSQLSSETQLSRTRTGQVTRELSARGYIRNTGKGAAYHWRITGLPVSYWSERGKNPDLDGNLQQAYKSLGRYGVTTRRAAYILERARGAGRVDGHGECGEDPFTVTWTEAAGYTVGDPATVADLLAAWGDLSGRYGTGTGLTESVSPVRLAVMYGLVSAAREQQARLTEALAAVDAAPHADTTFLATAARDYGPDSTPAANLAELRALRQLAAAVREGQRS